MTTSTPSSVPSRGASAPLSKVAIALQAAISLFSIALLSGGLLTWTVSGTVTRNSYSSFRAAQSIGLDGLTLFRVLWYLVPVFTAAVFFTLSGKWTKLASVVLGVQALIVGFGGIAVLASSVPTGNGPAVSIVFAIASGAVAVAGLRSQA